MMRRIGFCFFLCLAVSLSAGTSGFAATVKGSVKYDGKVPKFRPVKMDADPICAGFHSVDVMPQTLVLGEGQTMGNVFVRVKSGLPKKDYTAPTEPAVLDQAGCMYDPHVLGVMVGQPVKILNPDGTLHNVHSLSKVNPEFNLAMPKFRKEVTKTFDKPEFMFPIKCDVHPWMGAYVAVLEHPFFQVTEADGVFEIADLPPGTYEIEAWHEKLGPQTQSVTIENAEDIKEINFSFSRPGN